MTCLRPLATALLVALPGAALAQERPPLGQVPEIWEGLIQTALAYEIGERCDGIDSRTIQGLGYLLSLQARARSLGYSQEEVDAFVENKPEQQRLEAEARARLREMGAVDGDWDTYCEVGRAEIAAGTRTGLLLRD